MRKNRTSSLAPLLTVVVLLLIPPATYVWGYYQVGDCLVFWSGSMDNHVVARTGPFPGAVPRMYRSDDYRWLAFAYQPAAAVEQRLRGVDVSVSWEDEQIELLE